MDHLLAPLELSVGALHKLELWACSALPLFLFLKPGAGCRCDWTGCSSACCCTEPAASGGERRKLSRCLESGCRQLQAVIQGFGKLS